MKAPLVALLALFSHASARQTDDCESLFEASQEWGGGTQGFLRFVLEHEVHGWVLALEFDKPFNEFYVRKRRVLFLGCTSVLIVGLVPVPVIVPVVVVVLAAAASVVESEVVQCLIIKCNSRCCCFCSNSSSNNSNLNSATAEYFRDIFSL